MPKQAELELKGRAPDPVMQEAIQNPERVTKDGRRFRFVDFVGYLAAQYYDEEGNLAERLTPISHTTLRESRKCSS
jgi:hypothetical protein